MANEKWGGNNPWLGLAPYTEGTPLYGRTQESAVLSEIIKDNIATIVYGKSGIGKSSLLSAGISPMLRSEQYIPVPLRLVHNTDVSYVEQIENRVRELVDCKDELPENVPDLGLWDFFHRNTFTKDGVSCQPVIILDQFEEIYTLTDVKHKPEIITLFTELASLLNDIKPDGVLAAEESFTEDTTASSSSDDDFSFELSTESSFAYNETVSFRFVICLREDKLYLLERNSANIPSIKTNRYNLQALSPDSALEVIMYPRSDLFTKEDATAIVDKLADMGDEGIRTVDPAILSLFLYKYFEKKGEANYDNIFADYYHEATKGIKDKSLAFLEDHLLTLGGYRNQIPVDDALSSGVSQSEIDSLLKQIILRSEKRKGIDYIEFSHDRLCAEAKKSRDERSIRIQRRKLFVNIFWGLGILSVMISLMILYVIQSNRTESELLANSQRIEKQNKELDSANQLLQINETKKDSINRELAKALDCAKLAQQAALIEKEHARKAQMTAEESQIKAEAEKKKAELFLHLVEESHAQVKLLLEQMDKNNKQKEITEITDTETPTVEKICNYFANIRNLAETKNFSQLKTLADCFHNYGLSVFSSIRLLKGEVVSLNNHFIFNEEFLKLYSEQQVYPNAEKCNLKANMARGTTQGSVLYRNFGVKAKSSVTLSFTSRGYQELAVITEPGGKISLKIHITNNSGLDKTEYSTSNYTEGEPIRRWQYNFSNDTRNNVEIEVVNCCDQDVSFVIISN